MSAEATAAERDSNRLIESELNGRAEALEAAAGSHVISYLGPMYPPADDEVKDAIEEMTGGRRRRQEALLVVLETDGGLITVAERMARIFRHHYRRVDFLVPTFAMSAGTVLVMAGDDIYMDYASTLGPIDPQIRRQGRFVPALGYLEQYRRLVKKSAEGTLTAAEMAILIENFDQAELYQFEHERQLSIALLEQWLVKYKFKNWRVTASRKTPVTRKMRIQRATEIGEKLNDTEVWHSHSRGIPMEVLDRNLKLLIKDFGSDPALAQPVHDYFRLLSDYRMRRGHEFFVLHTKGRHVGY
jgi:Serine dehydrogenase proteinase